VVMMRPGLKAVN